MKNKIFLSIFFFFSFSCVKYDVPIKPRPKTKVEINREKAAMKFVEMIADCSPVLREKIEKMKVFQEKWTHFQGKIQQVNETVNKDKEKGFAIEYKAKLSTKIEVSLRKKFSKNTQLSLEGKGGIQKQKIKIEFQWNF